MSTLPTHLSALDFMVMAGYLAAIVCWGLWHGSRADSEGYFLGGRGMPWVIVGLSMFSTLVSSSSLVGWAGAAYSTGISVFNYSLAGGILPIVFFVIFFLPFYLRNKIYTLPEFLEGRFDVRSRTYLSVLTVVGYTFADLPVTLYAGALMLRFVFPGMNIRLIIWGLAALGAAYTIIGGLASVMWVELVQAVVLMAGSAVLTFTAFSRAGGWHAVMHATPPGHLSLIRPPGDGSMPWPALFISLPLLGFYYWGLSQTMVQRTLSARSTDHGRWGNLFAGGLNFAVFFLMVLPGIAGRVLYPDLAKGDQIYPRLIFEMLSPGLRGLMLVGFIGALTSVLTSTLSAAQTLLTMDIFKKLRPGMSSRQQVFAGSISGLAIILIAALWSPQVQKFDSIIKYFQQLASYLCPPVVAVFLCGLFWKRATATGAFASLISGFVIAGGLLFGIGHTPLAGCNFLYIAPVIFVCSLGIIFVVSLVTVAPAEDKTGTFVWSRQSFIDETIRLAGVSWFKNYRILAMLLLMAAGMFIVIWR
jgi:SSS family solute:Na+ symporter